MSATDPFMDKVEELSEHLGGVELTVYHGWDDCVLGYVERYGQEPHLLYDGDKIIDTLIARDDMTYDEAMEYYHHNILGTYAGESTPSFLFKSPIL